MKQTKHMQIDRLFIVEKIENPEINITFTLSQGQLVDILTKSLQGNVFEELVSKFGMYNIYNPI